MVELFDVEMCQAYLEIITHLFPFVSRRPTPQWGDDEDMEITGANEMDQDSLTRQCVQVLL